MQYGLDATLRLNLWLQTRPPDPEHLDLQCGNDLDLQCGNVGVSRRNVVNATSSRGYRADTAARRRNTSPGASSTCPRSSVRVGNIGQMNWAASKSGLLGLTKSMALEVAFLLRRSRQARRASPPRWSGLFRTRSGTIFATRSRSTVSASQRRSAHVAHFLAADASSYSPARSERQEWTCKRSSIA